MNWRQRLRERPAVNDRLSPRQLEVLAFIALTTAATRLPPSLREIQAHLGVISLNGVNDKMIALERKGWLRIDHEGGRGKSRAIMLTEKALTLLHGPPCSSCRGTGRVK